MSSSTASTSLFRKLRLVIVLGDAYGSKDVKIKGFQNMSLELRFGLSVN